jgi:DNA polymerase (family X)
MHSEWSDGNPTLTEISDACQARGYSYAAVTDHSYGLKIAGGMQLVSFKEGASHAHTLALYAVSNRAASDRCN